jgi:hypothetical protein
MTELSIGTMDATSASHWCIRGIVIGLRRVFSTTMSTSYAFGKIRRGNPGAAVAGAISRAEKENGDPQ